jgi:hypothetical protein
LSALGVFMPIPCAISTMKISFQIMFIDVINVIVLFLIFGIGSDCAFILFELFRQGKAFLEQIIS